MKPNGIVTTTYIAEPVDRRRKYCAIIVPDDIVSPTQRIPSYIKQGSDLELKEAEMIIESEAKHHLKERGYSVNLTVCVNGLIKHIYPNISIKKYIKHHSGADLMHGTGDVTACIRIALWLKRQLDENTRKVLFEKYQNSNGILLESIEILNKLDI